MSIDEGQWFHFKRVAPDKKPSRLMETIGILLMLVGCSLLVWAILSLFGG